MSQNRAAVQNQETHMHVSVLLRYLRPAGWVLIGVGVLAAFAAAAAPQIGLGTHDQFLTYRLMSLSRSGLLLLAPLLACMGAIFVAPIDQGQSFFCRRLASAHGDKTVKLVLGILILGYCAWALRFVSYFCYLLDRKIYCTLFDDGMISLRYARFASEGYGLVWNVDSYVEGYTNPLWTIIMIGIHLVAAPRLAPLVVQLIGMTMALAIMIIGGYTVTRVVTRETNIAPERHATFSFAICFIVLFSCYPLQYWSLTGMEVSIVCLCSMVAFYMFVRVTYGDLDPEIALTSCILLGLISYFARPDGFMSVVTPAAFIAYELYFCSPKRWIRPVAVLISGVIIVGLHIYFRVYYYGEVVPNTYTLKETNIDLLHRLSNGLIFLSFAWHYVLLFAVALVW
jgi:hypothetical protein